MEVDTTGSDGEARISGGHLRAVHAVGVLKNRKRKRKLTKFERRYTALGPLLKPEAKRIDYVLVMKNRNSEDISNEEKKESLQRKEEMRTKFEKALRKEGFLIKEEVVEDYVYKMLHCPFKRLCKEAELVKLEMPLKGCEKYPADRTNFFTEFVEKHFETDNELDYISAPFRMNKIHLFEGYENPTYFFRPALRSLLTHHILRNIDIRDRAKTKKKIEENMAAEEKGAHHIDPLSLEYQMHIVEDCVTDFCVCCPCYPKNKENPEDIVLSKMGLPYMLLKQVYCDAYILHEDSELSKINEVQEEGEENAEDEESKNLIDDPRKKLNETWTSFWKFQPLWKIRNYYGEKIALYFAWAGMLMTSLWIPMLFGIAVFIYGLTVSAERNSNQEDIPANFTTEERLRYQVGVLYNTISGSFDNDVTPWFALVICLWGTLFLEVWKRHNARLAYEWDVDMFEQNEPDRPEFFGTKIKKDPVTQEDNWFYPFKRQILKFAISASTLIFMVILVFVSLGAVIVYRVIVSVNYCTNMGAAACLVTTSIVSALLNAVSILILGKVYDWVAMKLTVWENHRTQTQFDDALIIKLFAFSFANSYSSCFYIAFIRGRFSSGVLGLGPEYNDECEGETGTCMSQLSFQILVLMLAKPIPRFLLDIVLPFLKRLWRVRPKCLRSTCCNNQVAEEKSEPIVDTDTHSMKRAKKFLRKERFKPPMEDFTLLEYTEKVVIYGFLMLFAAANPLAPLIALLILFVDKYIDAKRLIWLNRRPIPYIAQDIGMWYGILNFVNLIGVISNGFLIAFTSSWALQYSLTTRLWICIGFEHGVFALKFLLAYVIPDVPKDVRLAIRREKYQVAKKFEDKGTKNMDYSDLIPNITHDTNSPITPMRVRANSANYGDFPPSYPAEDGQDSVFMEAGGDQAGPGMVRHDLATVVEEDGAIPSEPKESVLADSSGNVSLRNVEPEGSLLNASRALTPVEEITNNATETEAPKSSSTKSPKKGSEGTPRKTGGALASKQGANNLPPTPSLPQPVYDPDTIDDTDEDDDEDTSTDSDVETDIEQQIEDMLKGDQLNPYTVVSKSDMDLVDSELHEVEDETKC